jgi:hypothetical protein
MTLKQVIFAVAQYGVVPKYPKNATAKPLGTQSGSSPTTSQTSIAQDIWKKVFG